MAKTSEHSILGESPAGRVGGPGSRLVTYNLLNSALACVRAENPDVGLLQVEDLCTLVDLFCLYDAVFLLGKNWEWRSPELTKENELAAALAENNFIRELKLDQLELYDFQRAHAKHIAAFLGQDLDTFTNGLPTVYDGLAEDYVELSDNWEVAKPTDLMNHLYERMRRELPTWDAHVRLGGTPDKWFERDRWARIVPERSAIITALAEEAMQNQRIHKFIMRTFVYVAYADIHSMSFTPDTARHPVVEGIIAEENQFRGRLTSALKSIVAETTPGEKDLLRRVPPLGAVLFQRAQTVHDIVPELVRLRDELAPLRERIGDLERQMLFGSRDSAIKAMAKWDKALDEVERNFGLEPRLITAKAALHLGESLGNVADNPTSFKSWFDALVQLPADVIRRIVARHTLIELHMLRPELPASERLRSAIQRIFYTR